LTFELRELEHFATRVQARTRTAAWIDEYNRDRKHSALGHAQPGRLRAHPGRSRRGQRAAAFAGVKAKPFGWPAASPDTSSSRRPTRTDGTAQKEHPLSKIRLTEVSRVPGNCQPLHVLSPEMPDRARSRLTSGLGN